MEKSCKYHKFEISRDLPDAQVEICVLCGIKVVYKKIRDRVDNAKYYMDHLRDFCQPWGRTAGIFAEIYGQEGINRAIKHAEFLKERATKTDWQQVSKEASKDMAQRDNYGKKMIST